MRRLPPGVISEVRFKRRIRARDGNRCASCGITMEERGNNRLLDVHRIVPGAPYTEEISVTLCHRCHKGEHRPTPSTPVRLHNDVADMAEKLAPIFGLSAPDFLSEILRPILEEKRKEGVKRLDKTPLNQKPKIHDPAK